MADGIDIDTNGNPWTVTFHSGGGTALPAVLIGAQNTGNIPFPFLPKRMVWLAGDTAAAGNKVIVQSNPPTGGTARTIFEATATGADYEPPQEWKRSDKDAGFDGAQITQFDAGVLFIYL